MKKLIRNHPEHLGTDFNLYSDDFIKQVQHKLNARSRKKLGFFSPAKLLFASLT